MTYSLAHIAERLREARLAKKLSQRALSKLAGVPQSHISKIESNQVDLRLSSLVAMANALGLEVTLVPRKTMPAVQSLVRQSLPSSSESRAAAQGANQMAYPTPGLAADNEPKPAYTLDDED